MALTLSISTFAPAARGTPLSPSSGTWVPANGGMSNVHMRTLAIDPAAPSRLYAGTYDAGVLKSTDSGASWAAANQGLTQVYVRHLAIDPATPSRLYAGTGVVFKSTDSGGTWAEANTGLDYPGIHALAIDPKAPATLYAGTGGGIFKSTDFAGTWAEANAGMPDPAVFSLVIDPATPATVYAGTGGTIFKSTDSAGTWAEANTGLGSQNVLALAVDPTTPSTLYAGSYGGGVFKSTDSGATWAAANTGLTNRKILALDVDPTSPATVYAGTRFGGAFKSTNSGGSWGPANTGLPDASEVVALVLDHTGAGTLYAGLFAGGAWKASPLPAAFVKGDMNGDGLPDLLFRSHVNGAQNQVWSMDGVVRIAEVPVAPDAASADWRIRGVDDFDADGRSDLVFWNQAAGNVEFWLMNGTTRVGAAVPLTGGPVLDPGWDLSATADFNHDGLPDIVWRNFTSQKIAVWTMGGTAKTGELVPTPNQAVNGNWVIVAALDYDDDGNTDFLWYNASSGKLVTWYMDAAVIRKTGQFTSPDAAGNANWKVVASLDLSRDSGPGTPPLGSPDVVWRNETSGNQVVWHMDFGSARVLGQFTDPAANSPALDWTIVGPR